MRNFGKMFFGVAMVVGVYSQNSFAYPSCSAATITMNSKLCGDAGGSSVSGTCKITSNSGSSTMDCKLSNGTIVGTDTLISKMPVKKN